MLTESEMFAEWDKTKTLLQLIVSPLRHISEELCHEVESYILEGANPSCVVKLKGSDRIKVALGAFHQTLCNSPEALAAHEFGRARANFRTICVAPFVPEDVTVRYFRCMATAMLLPLSPSIRIASDAAWFLSLAGGPRVRPFVGGSAIEFLEGVDPRRIDGCSYSKLHELATRNGVSDLDAMIVILGLADANESASAWLDARLRMKEYLQERQPMVSRLFEGVSNLTKRTLLGNVALHGLGDTYWLTLLPAINDKSESVRAHAERALGTIPLDDFRRRLREVLPSHSDLAVAGRLVEIMVHREPVGATEFIDIVLARSPKVQLKKKLTQMALRIPSTEALLRPPPVLAELVVPIEEPLADELSASVMRRARSLLSQMQRVYDTGQRWMSLPDAGLVAEVPLEPALKLLQEFDEDGALWLVRYLNQASESEVQPASIERMQAEPAGRTLLYALAAGLYFQKTFSFSKVVRQWDLLPMSGWAWNEFVIYSGFFRWVSQRAVRNSDWRLYLRVGGEQIFQSFMRSLMVAEWRVLERLGGDKVWPLFFERSEYIERGLGLYGAANEGQGELSLEVTLQILAYFPSIPARWWPTLFEIAVGGGLRAGRLAQKVLSKVPGIQNYLYAQLDTLSRSSEVELYHWIGRAGWHDAVPLLIARSGVSSDPAVQTAILTVLMQLGADVTASLTPAVLNARAVAELPVSLPDELAWFPMSELPQLYWVEGAPVPSATGRWLVVTAFRCRVLSEPGLLPAYLACISAVSAEELGRFVLHAFVAWDTRRTDPSDAESAARQATEQQKNYIQNAKANGNTSEWITQWSEEEFYTVVYRDIASQYLGSAIACKGLLLLCSRLTGAERVRAAERYMRDHSTRRAQALAMLEMVASNLDARCIQYVLATSARHGMASVRKRATEIVDALAAERGWTSDELADRTVPDAGLSARGEIELSYGPRGFVGRLSDSLALSLYEADGKSIKSLPAPRTSDDPESVKQAKAAWKQCSLDVKSIIKVQSARLYDSLLAERVWSLSDWEESLMAHVIVSRLVQRLIWAAEVEGTRVFFRPTAEREWIDASGNLIVLPPTSLVRLAHGASMSSEERDAWRIHLKEERVSPLFEQLGAPPVDDVNGEATLLDERDGWVVDAQSLHGAFAAREFSRGPVLDAGCCDYYLREFSTHQLTASIDSPGMPSTYRTGFNIRVGVLAFWSGDKLSVGSNPVCLSDVPPVVLSECRRMYREIAEHGSPDLKPTY